jgi:pimeloyl-ACP methyl ester carboxylesterase
MGGKMKKGWKITLIVLGALVLILLVGPFLIPVRPPEGTQPPKALADEDSEFIEINGVDIHYKQMGSGEPLILLLHGFGASTFSWREVMTPLSAYGTVVAYDRPAFGLTERPMTWEGQNPYTAESNMAILIGLMEALGFDQAVLVGNSAGGALATQFTLQYPERVLALVEVDAAVYQTMPDSKFLYWLFSTPQVNHLGPLFVRRLAGVQGTDFLESAWYDPGQITPEIEAGYRQPLMAENWDRALWQFTRAARAPGLADRLDEINTPTLVITGDNDRIVPTENSIRLAEEIPGAKLAILERCGHLPHEECPQAFMKAVDDFLSSVLEVIHE